DESCFIPYGSQFMSSSLTSLSSECHISARGCLHPETMPSWSLGCPYMHHGWGTHQWVRIREIRWWWVTSAACSKIHFRCACVRLLISQRLNKNHN
ncbi:MAG: hypothetical protein ACK56F_12335, partial [bacterium]